jgi:hypothetical protein
MRFYLMPMIWPTEYSINDKNYIPFCPNVLPKEKIEWVGWNIDKEFYEKLR